MKVFRVFTWVAIFVLTALWVLMLVALITNPGSGSNALTIVGLVVVGAGVLFLHYLLNRIGSKEKASGRRGGPQG